MKEDFEIHWIGIGYKGPVLELGYTLHPNNLSGGDMYGAHGAADLARSMDADIVFLLCDFWMLKNFRRALIGGNPGWINVAYLPLDGHMQKGLYLEDVRLWDHIVLYHEKAAQEVRQWLPADAADRCTHIYHGVDTRTYFPLSTKLRQEARMSIFGVRANEPSLFLLNANRYSERKDLLTTLRGFANARFRFNTPVYLVLHIPGIADLHRSELLQHLKMLDVEEHVLFNPLGNDYCSDEQLNLLYNACDIGINTSLGEGWGMVAFEHAATGAAQLVPDHTAPGVLWMGHAVTLSVSEEVQLRTNPFRMFKVDHEELSEKLITIVNDQAYRRQVGQQCRLRVISPLFSWEHIARQWSALWLGLLDRGGTCHGSDPQEL